MCKKSIIEDVSWKKWAHVYEKVVLHLGGGSTGEMETLSEMHKSNKGIIKLPR
jgi:hypothetical protein